MTGCHVSPMIFRTMNIMKLHTLVPPGNLSMINTSTRIGERPFWFRPITIVKVAEHSSGSGLVNDETLAQKKRELYQALEGTPLQLFSIYLYDSEPSIA